MNPSIPDSICCTLKNCVLHSSLSCNTDLLIKMYIKVAEVGNKLASCSIPKLPAIEPFSSHQQKEEVEVIEGRFLSDPLPYGSVVHMLK